MDLSTTKYVPVEMATIRNYDIEVIVAVVVHVNVVIMLPEDWLMPQLGFAGCWSLLQG